MFTSSTLRLCMDLAERVGKVTGAHMYDENFIVVEASSGNGKEFTITMNAREGKQNAEELE